MYIDSTKSRSREYSVCVVKTTQLLMPIACRVQAYIGFCASMSSSEQSHKFLGTISWVWVHRNYLMRWCGSYYACPHHVHIILVYRTYIRYWFEYIILLVSFTTVSCCPSGTQIRRVNRTTCPATLIVAWLVNLYIVCKRYLIGHSLLCYSECVVP